MSGEELVLVNDLARRLGRSPRAIRRAAVRIGLRKVEAFGVRRWAFDAVQCESIAANTHDGPGQPRKVRQAV